MPRHSVLMLAENQPYLHLYHWNTQRTAQQMRIQIWWILSFPALGWVFPLKSWSQYYYFFISAHRSNFLITEEVWNVNKFFFVFFLFLVSPCFLILYTYTRRKWYQTASNILWALRLWIVFILSFQTKIVDFRFITSNNSQNKLVPVTNERRF